MPSALHPRSRQTLSLFSATLAVSFLVVGMPHLFPCPAPRRLYADSPEGPDGEGRLRRSGPAPVGSESVKAQDRQSSQLSKQDANLQNLVAGPARTERECPVPKPRGWVGELLGFTRKGEANNNNNSPS